VRLILTLEYDGTPFRGWAAQPGLPTVEAAVRQALADTFASVENLSVAGRTDTGVHALGQVASVDVEGGPSPERAAAALNPRLPDEITVFSSAEAPTGFHARHSARSRSYRYRLFTRATPSPFERRRSWWHPRPVDEDALWLAATALVGEHDFRAFTPAQTQHEVFVRTVERAEWIRRGDHLDFEITANSYLRHMVRSLVGSMVEEPDSIAELLGSRARTEAGVTAPPWGLYLVSVAYGAPRIEVRPLTDGDRAWALQVETETWSVPVVARLGELVDPTGLPGFIALLDGEPAGLATYAIRGAECELVSIRSLREGRGVGRALLAAVRVAAIEAGCNRLWLITTNDNLRALELYQRWGMEIVAFHRHAVTESRRSLKPTIGERGTHGIPIAHELELEVRLPSQEG
jgi:tRNA pseudouridine38-40 synthase